MGVSEILRRLKSTSTDISSLSISLRTLSIKINAVMSMLVTLRLEEIQDFVLGTVAFGPKELENKGREDSSPIKLGTRNLCQC